MQVQLCAVVTEPTVTVSTDTLQFDMLQCGMCQVIQDNTFLLQVSCLHSNVRGWFGKNKMIVPAHDGFSLKSLVAPSDSSLLSPSPVGVAIFRNTSTFLIVTFSSGDQALPAVGDGYCQRLGAGCQEGHLFWTAIWLLGRMGAPSLMFSR